MKFKINCIQPEFKLRIFIKIFFDLIKILKIKIIFNTELTFLYFFKI
jgi:hypothetical protein